MGPVNTLSGIKKIQVAAASRVRRRLPGQSLYHRARPLDEGSRPHMGTAAGTQLLPTRNRANTALKVRDGAGGNRTR